MTMRNAFSLFLVALLVLIGSVAASGGRTSDTPPVAPAIGTTLEDFSLPDSDGKSHTLSSLRGKNGAVLIFVSVQCPISNAYNERMSKLAADYAARGINVIGINSNVTESADAVKAHAAEKHLSFVVLKDPGNKIADRLGAMHTPEVYYLDANNRLLYHGRIDNNKDQSLVETNDLREALDSVLSGKPVQKTTSVAFGCSIKRA